jgi:hypothetical protein
MREKILDSRSVGDSVGMNVTIYAKSGMFIDNFILKVELDVPPSSSSSVTDSTASSSEAAVSSSSTAEASSSSAE